MMKVLSDLGPWLKNYRRPYLYGAAATVLATAFQIIKPRLVQRALDSLEPAGDFGVPAGDFGVPAGDFGVPAGDFGVPAGDVGFSPDLSLLAFCACGMVLVMIGRGVFLFLTRRLIIFASRRIETDMRNDLFRHFQRFGPAFFHSRPTGDLMAVSTNDLAAVRQLLGPGIMYGVNTLVTGSFVIVNLLLISPMLTLISLTTLPVMAVVVFRFAGAIHRRFEKIQAQFGVLTARIQENLAGARVIRSYSQEEHEKELFAESNGEYVRLNRSYLLVHSAFRPAVIAIVGLGTLLMLFAGGRFIMDGKITVGGFTAFAMYLSMLVWPAIAVGWVTSLFQRGSASLKRIEKILETEPLIRDGEKALPLGDDLEEKGGRRIEIRDLSFRYTPEGQLVLNRVSAVIERGMTTAVIGPTGSGKTTLLNLLVRLYPAEEGAIFVDGREINTITLESLRDAFGFVPQETFLFSDTVGANISFARPEVTAHSVREVAEMAAFHEEIVALPDGYETLLGERGINLSGGQKQRTAIARALLKDPSALVLDDALSAVDTRTEEKILQNIKAFSRERTVIIVSHRISAVRHADQILVLRNGAIEERGRHDDLVRAGGIYAHMVEQQRLESEIEGPDA